MLPALHAFVEGRRFFTGSRHIFRIAEADPEIRNFSGIQTCGL